MEFARSQMDWRPRKRPRFLLDAPRLYPKVKFGTCLSAFGCQELEGFHFWIQILCNQMRCFFFFFFHCEGFDC